MRESTDAAYEVAVRMLKEGQIVACIPVNGGVYTFGGSTTYKPESESEIAGVALAACILARTYAEQAGLHPVE